MPDTTMKLGDLNQRFQEIKPGEYAREVYTVSAPSAAVAQQRFFIGGAPKLTLAAAGNVRATVQNLAGSGRTVFIGRLVITPTVIGWGEVRTNPTTGLPSTARTPQNAVMGSSETAVAVVNIDTNTLTALGGGDLWDAALSVAPNVRNSVDLPPLVIPPGVTLGLNFNYASAADIGIGLYWWEE